MRKCELFAKISMTAEAKEILAFLGVSALTTQVKI